MARDPRHDILFEPIQIGPKTLKNRFYQVPHCTGLANAKPFSHAEFRRTKAEGGWAAVCTEYTTVTPGDDFFPYVSARLWDDEDARTLGLMCDVVHAADSLAGIQLFSGGINAPNNELRMPAMSASALVSDVDPFVRTARAMTKDDIVRLQDDYAAAARRAREVGFDIVEFHCAHGETVIQFLSEHWNKRSDEYGGSFENRTRFFRETAERIKTEIGDDVAFVVRFSIATFDSSAIGVEDGLEFIAAHDDLVDLWNLNVGTEAEWHKDSGPSRGFEQGYQMEWVGRAKEVAKKPVLGVSRFTDPDLMAKLVEEGKIDIVGAARPSIADPYLPRKVEEGRLDEIRECIGCNICIKGSLGDGHMKCTQNPTAGEEFRRGWDPEAVPPSARPDRDALVIGGGPAGMECAMVLAKRGLRAVHLVEGEKELGGAMRWIPRLPHLGEWGRVVNYRDIQLQKLKQVQVIRGQRLDAAQARDYGADLIVVATGSSWADDGSTFMTNGRLEGADASQPHVLTPEQIMVEGKEPPGKRVVVYDTDGYFMGPGLAELLASRGHEVELLTPYAAPAQICVATTEAPVVYEQLHSAGVSVVANHYLASVEPGVVHAADNFEQPRDIEADALVLVTNRVADDSLYEELVGDPAALADAGVEAVYRAGDCVGPRLLADAIFDGRRLAMEIDEDDPSRPRPFRRERVLVGNGPEPVA